LTAALAPYLLIKDAEAVLTFCEFVLGTMCLRVIHDNDDGIMDAECRIGDTVLMMGEADGSPAMLHLYLDDPDAAFERGRCRRRSDPAYDGERRPAWRRARAGWDAMVCLAAAGRRLSP
jgi:hypothetical protein